MRKDLIDATIDATPARLTGKEWEECLVFRARKLETAGILTMSRYGVSAVNFDDEWRPVPSLPDFEGVRLGMAVKPFIMEAKVCSGSKHPFTERFYAKQLPHMMKRSKFGEMCFVALHFNHRETLSKVFPAASFMIPVAYDIEFWQRALRREESGITREQCKSNYQIEWNTLTKRAKRNCPAFEAHI